MFDGMHGVFILACFRTEDFGMALLIHQSPETFDFI
jgi:hypothetical protein